jgi:hypothetical protein
MQFDEVKPCMPVCSIRIYLLLILVLNQLVGLGCNYRANGADGMFVLAYVCFFCGLLILCIRGICTTPIQAVSFLPDPARATYALET